MCVKFYISRECRAHKNFQLFIKSLLKIFFLQNFVVFFGLLETTGIYIPSIKLSLKYHQQNFIYPFSKKKTVKYLFE